MKSFSILLCCSLFIFAQNNVKIVSQLSDFYSEKSSPFYFVYEIEPAIELNGNYGWSYTVNDNAFAVHELKSDEKNVLIVLNYDPLKKKIKMSSAVGRSCFYVDQKADIIFAGKQGRESGYEFLKALVDKGHHRLASYYVYHDPDRAFQFYKKVIESSSPDFRKKEVYHWISKIKSDESFDYLNIRYDDEGHDEKKAIVFAYRAYGKKGFKRLYEIAKNESDQSHDEARFWLANSAGKEIEKTFSEKIYSKDEITLKESAIFSLYNQHDFDRLKKVAINSKDIRLRKKAIFWLGQSHHVSVNFFADILDLN